MFLIYSVIQFSSLGEKKERKKKEKEDSDKHFHNKLILPDIQTHQTPIPNPMVLIPPGNSQNKEFGAHGLQILLVLSLTKTRQMEHALEIM